MKVYVLMESVYMFTAAQVPFGVFSSLDDARKAARDLHREYPLDARDLDLLEFDVGVVDMLPKRHPVWEE